MDTSLRDRRQELQALGPSLLGWANALARNPDEAQALVDEILVLAADAGCQPSDDVSTQVWVHRLLRRCFHSVERDRSYRRSPSAAVFQLGYARKRELEERAAAEAKLNERRSA